MPRHDYDSPWKEMLSAYFQQFMAFFMPDAHQEIDWNTGYELLDKELRQITRDAEIGGRLADHLVKLWKKNGEETWVLVHVEVQAQEKPDFPHRLYVYNYRIHDLYNRPAASVAVLADENPEWQPSQYTQELWGCRTEFHFPVVKLLTYADQQHILETSHNPFAIVTLAHLKTLETRKDDDKRAYWKVNLTKELYHRGFSKRDILKLYHFIDWLMLLPDALEQQCYQEIVHFEEEQKMPYITTAERIGLKKGLEQGRQEGRQEGIRKGTLIGEILLAQRLLQLTIYSQEELEQKPLDELKRLVETFETKLTKIEDQKEAPENKS